jgi:hypothetical protein
LTTHYTVTINSNGTGSATITSAGLALAPVSPTQYAIIGNRTISRSTDFTTGGDFFANTINDELDQQTIFAQQNAEAIQRSLTAPQTDPTTVDMTLPRASVRANKTLAFDSNGDPTTGEVIGDNRGNWAAAVAYNKRDVVKDTSNGNIYYANTSHTSTGSQPISSNADVAKWDLLVDNASSAASATAAASSASAASTSASNASSSASAASTSASNASTSASTASTQASNAATSATAASGSATSAANSAAAAASALDSFDDRYLGTKSSDPTLDNDGNALATGALYFSTTANVMKVYDGSSWIAATSAGATSLLRFRYVATSGQTTFTGADAASATLSYTVNNIAVHRNGVTLDTSEYTASNGTSIILAVAAGTGDIIDIIAFKSFTVSDALSALTGGTVNGAVTITGALTAQAGTVSLPAITTAGDTNTGIFFPAADTIAFAEGGVESVRIDSSSNLSMTGGGTINTPNTFGFKNRLINSGMTIDQRNAGASVTPSNTATYSYLLDRWAWNPTQASKVTFGQNLNSVTPPTGFSNYLGAQVGVSANVVVGAGDYFFLNQPIEGFNFADFNYGTASAQPLTLSFWVRSSLTGTFGGTLENSALNRGYPFTYTISSANTWTQVSVNVVGDTTGTWVGATNGIGLYVRFSLGAGSTYSGTAGSWQAINTVSATGSVNVVATNSATWYITGVQLEKGTQATSFDFRSYGTELALCQRYYEVFYADNAGEAGFSSTWSAGNRWIWHLKVQKRATSTFSLVGGGNWQVNTPSIAGGISSCGAYSGSGIFYLNSGSNAIAGSANAEL